MLFAVVIAIPAVGHWRFHLNAVLAFWFAYIVTRPLGASFADWVVVPAGRGGLDWGTGPIALALILLIVCCVGNLAVTGKDVAPGLPTIARPPRAAPQDRELQQLLATVATGEGGPTRDGLPGRWLQDPTWRCVNFHVAPSNSPKNDADDAAAPSDTAPPLCS